jgi:DHA2 family multidrug resistance protein-like MFS transporter
VIASAPRQPGHERILGDGLPMPIRLWAVLALGLGVFLSGLDASIANVALPTISHEMNITPVDAIWIVNAYQLAMVSGLLASSALGEIVGYRRIFLAGALLFTLASLSCALAPNLPVLIAARVAQGIGAAGVQGVSNALLRHIFPQRMIGRGFGIYALIASSGTSLGPSVATAILAVADWPWLFGVAVPLGIVAVLAGLRTLPPTDRIARPFDISGAFFSALSLILLLLGIDGLAHHAEPWAVVLELLGAAAAGYWLVRLSGRKADPMLPLDLFRIPIFRLSMIVSLALYSTQFLAFVSLPFYFRDHLGLSQVETGILMTPWPLIMTLAAPFSGWLADRYSPGILCGLGMLIVSVGLFLLLVLPAHPEVPNILWRMMVCGIGWALVVPPNSRIMMISAPLRRAGAASGMTATTRNLGQTLGAAMTALTFGLFATSATAASLVLGIILGILAATLSFRRRLTPSTEQST